MYVVFKYFYKQIVIVRYLVKYYLLFLSNVIGIFVIFIFYVFFILYFNFYYVFVLV